MGPTGIGCLSDYILAIVIDVHTDDSKVKQVDI